MHPLLQGRLRPVLYFMIWLGIGAGLVALLVLLTPRPLNWALLFIVPLVIAYAFVCLSSWWVARAHPLGTTTPFRIVTSGAGAALQSAALWVVGAGLWAIAVGRMTGFSLPRDLMLRDLLVLFVAGIVLYVESLAAHYFLLAFDAAREAERRVLASQVSAREAELRALRAQLNPHFLFNSLNSISALAGSDPAAARNMCTLLADFLRTSLSLGSRGRVSLAEEIGLAERYLAIEQVRFGERLQVSRTVDPDAEACLVPPLLVQPLIENAVKHGVADQVEGGTVRIAARRLRDLLEVEVENSRDPEAPPRRGAGMGLDNVRRRLEAIDANHGRLAIERAERSFRVTLTLPAEIEATR